jgi:hypothetical protein
MVESPRRSTGAHAPSNRFSVTSMPKLSDDDVPLVTSVHPKRKPPLQPAGV